MKMDGGMMKGGRRYDEGGRRDDESGRRDDEGGRRDGEGGPRDDEGGWRDESCVAAGWQVCGCYCVRCAYDV